VLQNGKTNPLTLFTS